jgi:hypothetical protein
MIKRKGNSQIEILILDHKSPEKRGQMMFDLGMLYIVRKIFLKVISYCTFVLNKKIWFEKDMNVQNFGILKVPI